MMYSFTESLLEKKSRKIFLMDNLSINVEKVYVLKKKQIMSLKREIEAIENIIAILWDKLNYRKFSGNIILKYTE